jgi:hypothetical protein
MAKHPIQPLELQDGVLRFKSNAIVKHLLDSGAIDMNEIAVLNFTREDREQFAQLIGYSHGGASDLSYMSDVVLEIARMQYESGESQQQQLRIKYLEAELQAIRDGLRNPVAKLFGLHPDDLDAVV